MDVIEDILNVIIGGICSLTSSEIIIETQGIKKYYPLRRGFSIGSREVGFVHAVDGVNLIIPDKEVLGVVGESGCG